MQCIAGLFFARSGFVEDSAFGGGDPPGEFFGDIGLGEDVFFGGDLVLPVLEQVIVEQFHAVLGTRSGWTR